MKSRSGSGCPMMNSPLFSPASYVREIDAPLIHASRRDARYQASFTMTERMSSRRVMERSPEEYQADDQPEDHDDGPEYLRGQSPGDAGAGVPADDRGRGEDQDVDPVDLAGDGERDDRDAADDGRDGVLQRADPGHRLVEDQPERGDEH